MTGGLGAAGDAATDVDTASPMHTLPQAEYDRIKADLRMYHNAYWQVQQILDQAHGENEDDGSGEGIAADVALLAGQRDEARARIAAVEALCDGPNDCGGDHIDRTVPLEDRCLVWEPAVFVYRIRAAIAGVPAAGGRDE